MTDLVVRSFHPDDPDAGAALAAYAEVLNAARRVDAPWQHPATVREAAGWFRHGWDLEPPVGFLGFADGTPVAAGECGTSERDNRHLAWLDVQVHPDHRRRGHGSAFLAGLLDQARALGRTTVGAAAWDAPGPAAFARRHGFEEAAVQVQRRQLLAELDREALERRYAEALPHAAAYAFERRFGRSPEADLAPLAELTAAINDAPTDDLDLEDEVYDAARVAAYETSQLDSGRLLHRVVARHRGSGELAGHSVVLVDGERPHLAEQHDTAVARAHRGHRLGLLLKLEMLRWLAEAQPQLESLDTWNAESNGHMIAVNEQLGYRVVGREVDWQRRLAERPG